MKLNLGCGKLKLDGFIGVDKYAEEADEKVDLAVFPWPYPDNSVDEIFMQWALEHFDRPENLIREMHRILKPGGTTRILVPHKDSLAAYAPDHRYFFTRLFFEIFMNFDHYLGEQYKCMFVQKEYKIKLWYGHWTPFDYFASRFPKAWEKFSFSCFRPSTIEWVGVKV